MNEKKLIDDIEKILKENNIDPNEDPKTYATAKLLIKKDLEEKIAKKWD